MLINYSFCNTIRPQCFIDSYSYDLNPGNYCKINYHPITSKWQDCKRAAESLGYTGDSVAHVDYEYPWGTSRPQGCFLDRNNRFHFNKGVGGKSTGGDKILCRRQREVGVRKYIKR